MLVASGIGAWRATSAMPSMPGVGSSRYSSTPSSCAGDLDRGVRGPGRVRVEPQRKTGEGVAQRADRLDLLLGREHPALELERGEAVAVDEPPGLGDDRRPGRAPRPSRRRRRPDGRPTCRTGTRRTAPRPAPRRRAGRRPAAPPPCPGCPGRPPRTARTPGRSPRCCPTRPEETSVSARVQRLDPAVDLLGVVDVDALDRPRRPRAARPGASRPRRSRRGRSGPRRWRSR